MIRSRRHPRGLALVLTIMAVAMTVVIGYALLSSVTLQAQVNANVNRAAAAGYLAESGVATAMYYLQHPESAPSLNSSGHYPGQIGIIFGSDVDGSTDVVVASLGSDKYRITAVGRAGPVVSTRVARTLTVVVAVKYKTYVVPQGVATNSSFGTPSQTTVNVTGDLDAMGALAVTAPSSVSGNVRSVSASSLANWSTLPQYPLTPAPTSTQVGIIGTTGSATPGYVYNGVTYAASLVTGGAITNNLTANPTVNPANVWYSNASVNLSGVTFNGTLVVRGTSGNVVVTGTNRVTPKSGMPGLVINKQLQFKSTGAAKKLTVDGLVWVGDAIATTSGTATSCELVINGALQSASYTQWLNSNYRGTIRINYTAANVTLPGFADSHRLPDGIKSVQWGR